MIRYRSYGRQQGGGAHVNTLPEPAEQNFREGHHWAKSGGNGLNFDRRIAFGMPLGYTTTEIKWVAVEAGYWRATAHSTQGGYRIAVLSGALGIASDWRRLWPLLALGGIVHGGRATQGYGRFRVEAA